MYRFRIVLFLVLWLFPVISGATVLVAPADNSSWEPVSVLFQWQPVAGATSYTLQWGVDGDGDGTFEGPSESGGTGYIDGSSASSYKNVSVSGATEVRVSELYRYQTIYWRVKASNESVWSDTRSFFTRSLGSDDLEADNEMAGATDLGVLSDYANWNLTRYDGGDVDWFSFTYDGQRYYFSIENPLYNTHQGFYGLTCGISGSVLTVTVHSVQTLIYPGTSGLLYDNLTAREITLFGSDGTTEIASESGSDAMTTLTMDLGAIPAAPVVTAPADEATDVSPAPYLTWAAVDGADTYSVEVDDNAAFSSPSQSSETAATLFAVLWQGEDVDVYCRVRANQGALSGPWTTVHFVTAGAPVLDAYEYNHDSDNAYDLGDTPLVDRRDLSLSSTLDEDWFRFNYGGKTFFIRIYKRYDDYPTGWYQLKTSWSNTSVLTIQAFGLNDGSLFAPDFGLYAADAATLIDTAMNGKTGDAVDTIVFDMATAIGTPEVVAPLDAASGVATDTTLQWTDVAAGAPYGNYTVRLAKDADISINVQNFSPETNSQALSGLEGNTVYYWKVEASSFSIYTGNAYPAVSAVFSFSTAASDTDGDGIADDADAYPNDPAASVDTDKDGFPDAWNTGKSESDSTTGLTLDAFPTDAGESVDSDGDGVGDNGDAFPDDAGESADADGDGLGDNLESAACTDVNDADTDNDGVGDGVEDADHNGVMDAGETNACSADTDGDGLQDGTEMGYVLADIGADTDINTFQPDLDPASNTDPLDPDSDKDKRSDGAEDANHNGRVDAGETDPADAQSKSVVAGDIDDDGDADLADGLLALQVVAGLKPLELRSDYVLSGVDVNGDNRIGNEEVLYLLGRISGMRP